jgi:hypothetical protein
MEASRSPRTLGPTEAPWLADRRIGRQADWPKFIVTASLDTGAPARVHGGQPQSVRGLDRRFRHAVNRQTHDQLNYAPDGASSTAGSPCGAGSPCTPMSK